MIAFRFEIGPKFFLSTGSCIGDYVVYILVVCLSARQLEFAFQTAVPFPFLGLFCLLIRPLF